MATSGLRMMSKVSSSGEVLLFLEPNEARDPEGDEILIKIDGAPINPSDLGMMFGPADTTRLRNERRPEGEVLRAEAPPERLRAAAARLDRALACGNEGTGRVVKAGPGAAALLGRRVSTYGGAMYAEYKLARAGEVLVLGDDATPAEAASCFVNPLTALGMVETMRLEGHSGLIHTAAASNLGQMLVKICLQDEVPLVNIVRSSAQAESLKALGARHVLVAGVEGFREALADTAAETGATLAFDALGGGRLADQILTAMETALGRKAEGFSRYGTSVHKQIYLYGGLETRPTELTRGYGMSWGVGGWLLPLFLAKVGDAVGTRLRARVAAELRTTFASAYAAEISLKEALQADIAARYAQRATGGKYLIRPDRA